MDPAELVSVNRRAIRHLQDLRKAARDAERLLINIERGDGALFILIR